MIRIAFIAAVVLGFAAATFAAEPKVTIVPPLEGAKVADARFVPTTLPREPNPAGGTLHVVYNKDGGPVYASSIDGGKTFSTPIPVLRNKPAIAGLEFDVWEMNVNEKGKVFVVMGNNGWKLNIPKEQSGMYLSILEPGAKEFSATVPLNAIPSEGFSIAASGDNVVASWLANKLYWKHSTDGGKTFTANKEIDPAYLPCPCCTTSAAIGKDGTTAIMYRESTRDQRDIHVVLARGDKHTRTLLSKTPWIVSACPMTYYRIAPLFSGDGFVAAWPTRGEAYFSRISSKGEIWKPGEIKVGGKTGMRSSVFALSGANDTTLVAWKDAETLHYRVYDKDGKPTGEEQQAKGSGPLAGGAVTKSGDYILFP